MSKQLISIGKAADRLGVCIDTLREWDKNDILKPIKTAGNHRRYRVCDIDKMNGELTENKQDNKTRVAVYSRVSSHEQKQKGDLRKTIRSHS